jgi:hypothetical protein
LKRKTYQFTYLTITKNNSNKNTPKKNLINFETVENLVKWLFKKKSLETNYKFFFSFKNSEGILLLKKIDFCIPGKIKMTNE